MSTAVKEQTPQRFPVEPSLADVLYATEPASCGHVCGVDEQAEQKQDTASLRPARPMRLPADAKQEPVAKAEGKTEEKPDPKDEQLKAQTAAARRLEGEGRARAEA